MTDPKQKIQELLNKQKKTIEAQQEESARIEKERQQANQAETAQSFHLPERDLNK